MSTRLLPALIAVLLLPAIHCNTPARLQGESFFYGKIVYDYTYESNMLDMDSLVAARPYRGEFRYDADHYQSRFIGKDTTTYLYAGTLNRAVSQTNSGTFTDCEDYGIATDSVLWYKVYDTDERVQGHRCRVIEYQGKYFRNKYYVSTDLRIAPGTYQKHIAYNWAFYGNQTGGGLILKLEHYFKKFIMRGEMRLLQKLTNTFDALEGRSDTVRAVCSRQ
jgi:hypothetical protein